jgi:outer membrane receptor protein involved in Fe transport
MNSNCQVAVAVRRALILSAMAATSMSVHAQDQVSKVETVTVTGSRIVRKDYEAPSPVVTLDADAFKMSGEVQVEAVLNTLPQLVASITTTSNNPSNGGQANVDLRGFGTQRTLVLLDGTRLTASNVNGVIDLNTIPAALIDNVEILTGGASSTYGSDAVAGVVNVKMKRNFTGVQLNVQNNRTAESDGKTTHAEALIGGNFADNRGNAVVALSYDQRDEVLAGARSFSQVGLGSALTPTGSSTVPDGSVSWGRNAPTQSAINSVFAKYGAAPNSVLPTTTIGFNTDGTLFSFGNANNSATPVVNYKGNTSDPGFNPKVYSYNFAPVNYLQLPLERRQIAAFTHYEILPDTTGASAEVYSRLMFTTYHSDQQLASTPVTCSSGALGCTVPTTVLLGTSMTPVANPVLPTDLAFLARQRATPNASLAFTKRLGEAGPRTQENNYDTLQGLLGMRGDFKLGDHDLNWDVFASWGRVQNTSLQGGNISRSRLQAALTKPDTYASQGCALFNPFGAGTLSAPCATAITINASNVLSTEETNFVGSLTGALFKVPAGAVRFAAGAEYREDRANFRPDQFLASGDVVGFNAQQPVAGHIKVTEPFAELSIPLLADKPFANYLGLDLGYRHSTYNLSGGANTYKASLEWNPIRALKIRGGYNRSIRAPNISELFLPVQEGFPGATDPCNANGTYRAASNPAKAQVEALCRAQGITAAALTTYTQPNSQIKSFVGGDATLQPEKADGYSLGLVFQPAAESTWLRKLNASVDFYRIQIDDVINSLSTSSVLGRCFNQLNSNPTFDPNNQFCRLFTRDVNNFGATDVVTITKNLSSWKGSGVDLNVNWGLPLSALHAPAAAGDLDFRLLWTRLLSREQQETAVDPFIAREGTISSLVGSTYPKNKAVLATIWSFHAWQVRYNVRYISSMDVVNNDATLTPSTGLKPRVPSYLYHDITARWTITQMFNVIAGVDNIADKQPPIYTTNSGAGIQANTDPSTYDVLGRRYFLNFGMKF